MWIWLVLLYGILKGCREICKKKALVTSPSIEVLLVYTIIGFLLVCPDAKSSMGLPPVYYLYIALKAIVIFIAWICSFKAIKLLPLSFYGVLDLSRVLFATTLGVAVLGEKMLPLQIVGLILVCAGLLLLKFKPRKKDSFKDVPRSAVILALLSCMLNAVSGLLDKLLMKSISSSQLQFWFMLMLSLLYIGYAVISKKQIVIKRALTNKWIWILSVMFIIGDRALFLANGMADSRITVMTLIKQSGCIVTILAGRFIFKEKNTTHKIICAAIIILGIVLGTL